MYYDMLLDKWNKRLYNILSEDNYSCMEIQDEIEYKKFIKQFPCQLDVGIYFLFQNSCLKIISCFFIKKKKINSKFKNHQYPKRMPYSSCVPKIFNEIKDFVNNCVKFADGLNSRYKLIIKTINKIACKYYL